MTSRRELTKLGAEHEERLRARRHEAYADFYAVVFGIATAALEEYEVNVLKELPSERLHDSFRLRAVIGLLRPESISRQAEDVLATLSGLDSAARDPLDHAGVPSLAIEVRRQVDQLLASMREVVKETAASSVAALPSRGRGLRRAGRPA